jgi:neutral amino acid transport system substrate-binding protein
MLFARKGVAGISDGGIEAGPADAGGDAGGGPIITCRRLAIVNLDNAYGNSMADVIVAKFKRAGETIVIRKVVRNELQSNYSAEASEIIALQPECMAVITYDDIATQFVRDFKAAPGYLPLEARGFFFIGTDGVYTSGFLTNSRENKADETSKNSAEGVYGTNPDTQPGTREYNEFRTIYSAYSPLKPAEDAPAFAANTFDAAILIALAVQKAGRTNDGVAIRNALREVATKNVGRSYSPAQVGDALIAARDGQGVNYKGASGDVDFDKDGNVTAGFIIWRATRDPVSKTIDYKTVARFPTPDLEDQLR